MIFIKHRCNDLTAKYEGPIEIDVWGEDKKLFIGHEHGKCKILPSRFEFNHSMWVHCKNVEAYKIIRLMSDGIRCFMHDEEPIAVVNNGGYWTTIPKNICGLTVFMDVDGTKYSIEEIEMIRRGHGVCSDHPETWKELFQ